MLKIEHSLEIAASVDEVWSVIVDADRYAEWNPFVVGCKSSLVVGEPIKMKVKVLPWVAMPQKETILEHEPGKLLNYGIAIPLGILASTRKHILTPLENGHTRYESQFCLSGWLAPLVDFMLGNQLRRGFSAMTVGIRDRVLSLK
jgi:uncharacterized protein YndB with AHSA1/START domain